MDNYEIKILKRNGNWEKSDKKVELINSKKIIDKLETLENDKNNLITELLQYEKNFISKKNIAEQKKSQISKEIEMFDKTIDVIKNLKKF